MSRTVFVDFEASSLGRMSVPIEVAWVFDNGEAESHLIRPAPDWIDWADSAQAIHGIPRERLVAEGKPHDWVAGRMVDGLAGHALYATAPSWDGQWLSKLLRAAGRPRHALGLEDTTVAHRRVVREVLEQAGVPPDQHDAVLKIVLDQAERRFKGDAPPAHRALDDAKAELQLWRAIRRLAGEVAARP